jgi:MFS family permease
MYITCAESPAESSPKELRHPAGTRIIREIATPNAGRCIPLKPSSETAAPREPDGSRAVFRALRHRNYRLFFIGQGVSLIGTWMQQIAVTWLVYRLSGSTLLLGVVGFATSLPMFLLSTFAGVLADRFDQRRMLLATQTLSMLQAAGLAVLTLADVIEVWHIVPLAVLLGVANAFDMPTRQAFLIRMIDEKADLGNAIALNSSMVNGARLIGPSLAGLLIAAVGEGTCFLINAISYLAVLASLLAMRVAPLHRAGSAGGMWRGWKEGVRYAAASPLIAAILLLLALVSMMGMPYTVLLPVFARDILGGGPHTLGFLAGAAGVGALGGALLLASRRRSAGLVRWIPSAALCFAAGLCAFSFSRVEWLSMLALALAGFGMMVGLASSNTILQTVTADDKRGRVMSLYATAFLGMTPFGALLSGSLATVLGAPRTVLASSIVIACGALVFRLRLSAFADAPTSLEA